MKITNGLFDHIVLQRNARNVSHARITGVSKAAGTVMATVTAKADKPVRGLAGVRVGEARGGTFSACLKGLPAGGPYGVELTVTGSGGVTLDQCAVGDVLVGDVWILGGQSNMQGIGDKRNGLKSRDDVRAFFMDDRWGVAKEPIHDLSIAVDPVHTALSGGSRPAKPGRYCAGPGFPFALRMREIAGVPQGVIACAHGGTSMSQWSPKLKRLGGKSLYGAMLRRFVKNGGNVAGIVWYQGCSDANAEAAPLFTRRLKAFVAACRRDLKAPALPFVMVQIARVVGWGADAGKHWNSIQDQQRRLPALIPRCLTVPAIDLPLDDGIHVSGRGMPVLGGRLAQAMDALLRGAAGGKPPIALRSVHLENDPGHVTANVIVDFANVMGGLRAGGRPSGFTVAGPTTTNVYDVKLDATRAIVRTSLTLSQLNECALYYGFGTDPYCNIGDEADRSLPAFGPVPLGKPRATTPFVTALRVSGFQPSDDRLDTLNHLPDIAALNLKPMTFGGSFCDMHAAIAATGAADHVLYYACAIDCAERMKLTALLGYDGPVKLWVDGRPIYHDPDGINPAVADAHAVRFDAARGRHEILIALGTNHGAAWGVYLRFERRDVAPARIKAGPEHYNLPRILAPTDELKNITVGEPIQAAEAL